MPRAFRHSLTSGNQRFKFILNDRSIDQSLFVSAPKNFRQNLPVRPEVESLVATARQKGTRNRM
jgi:hypothetical protein